MVRMSAFILIFRYNSITNVIASQGRRVNLNGCIRVPFQYIFFYNNSVLVKKIVYTNSVPNKKKVNNINISVHFHHLIVHKHIFNNKE